MDRPTPTSTLDFLGVIASGIMAFDKDAKSVNKILNLDISLF